MLIIGVHQERAGALTNLPLPRQGGFPETGMWPNSSANRAEAPALRMRSLCVVHLQPEPPALPRFYRRGRRDGRRQRWSREGRCWRCASSSRTCSDRFDCQNLGLISAHLRDLSEEANAERHFALRAEFATLSGSSALRPHCRGARLVHHRQPEDSGNLKGHLRKVEGSTSSKPFW